MCFAAACGCCLKLLQGLSELSCTALLTLFSPLLLPAAGEQGGEHALPRSVWQLQGGVTCAAGGDLPGAAAAAERSAAGPRRPCPPAALQVRSHNLELNELESNVVATS